MECVFGQFEVPMLDIWCIYLPNLLKKLSDLLMEWLSRTLTGFNRCNMLASGGLAHGAQVLFALGSLGAQLSSPLDIFQHASMTDLSLNQVWQNQSSQVPIATKLHCFLVLPFRAPDLLRHPALDFISATLLCSFHALHLPSPALSFGSSYITSTPRLEHSWKWICAESKPHSCCKP